MLLLDEPLSALDAKVRRQLREEIRRIQIAIGITTLFVTHDQEEALAMGDRVGVMSAGRLEQIARAGGAVRPSRGPRFVAEFVGPHQPDRGDGRRRHRGRPGHARSRSSRDRPRPGPSSRSSARSPCGWPGRSGGDGPRRSR